MKDYEKMEFIFSTFVQPLLTPYLRSTDDASLYLEVGATYIKFKPLLLSSDVLRDLSYESPLRLEEGSLEGLTISWGQSLLALAGEKVWDWMKRALYADGAGAASRVPTITVELDALRVTVAPMRGDAPRRGDGSGSTTGTGAGEEAGGGAARSALLAATQRKLREVERRWRDRLQSRGREWGLLGSDDAKDNFREQMLQAARLHVRKVHLQYVDGTSDPAHPFTLGLLLRGVRTVDEGAGRDEGEGGSNGSASGDRHLHAASASGGGGGGRKPTRRKGFWASPFPLAV